MKTVYLNVQAKGGAGKSMLTYLQALKQEANNKAAFVDLDSSTKTSSAQLKFLRGKTPNRM
jgi:cellulose biosynthesis protein BcsQ